MLAFFLALPLAAAPVVFKVQTRTPQGNRIVELPIEKYVAGVVAGESSVFRSDEALKAMAVAARTYAVRLRGRHSAEGFDFCSSTHCQRLDLEAVTPRIESAAARTAGELLWFEGNPAFACYTRDCGGRTEDGGAVWPDQSAPYLKRHDDAYCTRAGAAPWQWNGDPLRIAEALRRSGLRTPPSVEHVEIVERTESGRARTLLLSGRGESQRISAGSFRFAMGRELGWSTVLSDRYEVRSSNGRPVFAGSGWGHGVGLCQRGADQMGVAGKNYRAILAFYYPGTEIGLTGRGISWRRIGGSGIALLTTRPERDRVLLPAAERILGDLAQRANLAIPRDIEVRVYPDIDTFRNATGEPGWVAAHTQGSRIEMQPPVVESTLRHELLHVVIEPAATADLPLWFREGLVEYLSGASRPGQIGDLSHLDADLRQTSDQRKARRAYADSVDAVSALVARYGLTSVLAWLHAGLPPEVRNANVSHAPTKSR